MLVSSLSFCRRSWPCRFPGLTFARDSPAVLPSSSFNNANTTVAQRRRHTTDHTTKPTWTAKPTQSIRTTSPNPIINYNKRHLRKRPQRPHRDQTNCMENLNAVDPGELPEGFTTTDPNNPSASSSSQGHQQPNDAAFKKQAVEEQKQMILEQAMDREALARLSRIKMVKPQKAAQVENAIVAQAMSGNLPGRISEAKLIEILERKERATAIAQRGSGSGAGSGGGGGGIQIQRKRYNMDSDDDEDDDDV